MWLDFDVRDNRRCTFSLRKSYHGLWTRISVKNVLMMDLFQLLSSRDVNWWTGVLWIIVMFLSAVWTLILTAPIHCRASTAEQFIPHFFLLKHLQIMCYKVFICYYECVYLCYQEGKVSLFITHFQSCCVFSLCLLCWFVLCCAAPGYCQDLTETWRAETKT